MSEYIIKYNGILPDIGFRVEVINENYAIVEMNASDLPNLRRFPQIETAEPSKPLFVSLQRSLGYARVLPVQREARYGLDGEGVIVGVIDSGIDLTHPEFLDADGGSRVLFLWDLSQEGTQGIHGIEYTKAEINLGVVSCPDSNGHGTAVACIAAGAEGVAPKADLICVKLGRGCETTTGVMRGVAYVIEKAKLLGKPCVINLSYGTNDGSHSGNSLFETYMESMALRWKTVIVCATGNEGYGGHHFSGKLSTQEPVSAAFFSSRNREMELILWKNFADRMYIELQAPNGTRTGPILPEAGMFFMMLDNVWVTASYRLPNQSSYLEEIRMKIHAPTGIPSGIRTMTMFGTEIVDGAFDIWLSSVEELSAQTAFLSPHIDLTMTLPSTVSNVISVGGYRADTGQISSFSGQGGEMNGNRIYPDLVAPAERIHTAKPMGGYDTYSGTSMAAPFVTGAAALIMQWGIVQGNDSNMYGQKVKAFLCRNADRSRLLDYPDPAWGYGTLDLQKTIQDIIRTIQPFRG